MAAYQPKTGERCSCRPGVERDNCPSCEGTGWRIDFRAIRERVIDFDKLCSKEWEGKGWLPTKPKT